MRDGRLPAQFVQPPDGGFELGDRGHGLVSGREDGQRFERVVVQLGNGLAAVAPNHPSAVGVRARHQGPEVAGAEPGVLDVVATQDLARPGRAGQWAVVLLVTTPVGDGVDGVRQVRVTRTATHRPSVAGVIVSPGVLGKVNRAQPGDHSRVRVETARGQSSLQRGVGSAAVAWAYTVHGHGPHPSADDLRHVPGSGLQFCSTTQQTPAGGDPTGPCLQRVVGG